MKSGIYIHIPFCRNKCDYCAFYSIPVCGRSGSINNEIIESYIDTLLLEIDFITGKSGKIAADTVYFGGGTPSILKPSQVELIIRRISDRFILGSDPEISLEMNPDDLLEEKLDGFIKSGVNRIVLGVQSLDPGMRNHIGRRGMPVDKAGFDLFFDKSSSRGNFTRCIDIMAGLPGQNEQLMLKDLETVTSYRPEHISLYLLSVEDDTPLGKRFLPDDRFDAVQADLWGKAMDYLADKGYVHYEISNYALPGFESRHNSKYWDFSTYYGFGAGAHSFADGKRYSNNLHVNDYINRREFVYDVESPQQNNTIVEFIMTSLRRIKGFSAEEFEMVTAMPIPGTVIDILETLEAEGMIRIADERYSLTRKGLFYTDSVIYRLTEQFL